MKYLFVLLSCGLALSGLAEVKVESLNDGRCRVVWDGREVVSPFRPELRLLGGGAREWFDPNSRKYCKLEVPAAQDGLLVVNNQKGQKVFLGAGKTTTERRDGGVIFREDFPAAATMWQVSILPVEGNGLDLVVEVATSPEYWLGDFDITLLGLNMTNALCDSGAISSWYRKDKTLDSLGPLNGDISICYPNGPNTFVPAAVLQDSQFAVGVCLLGAHIAMRQDFSELSVTPDKTRGGYWLRLRSSDNPFFGNVYRQSVTKRFRLRFAEPKPLAGRTYLSLLDAKDLWKDYVAELDKYLPPVPTPQFDHSKNNIIAMNFFLEEDHLRTERNPQGWLMNDPNWRTSNPWEWNVPPAADDAEAKRITGFSQENFGRPVKWIKAYAERCVREMQEANCQAMITWQAALNPGRDTTYIPESHLFHPGLEELMPVEGPVRNWDWVVADIAVVDAQGQRAIVQTNVLIQAANPELLIQLDQMARPFGAAQRLFFKKAEIQPAGERFLASAAQLGPWDRLTAKNVLIVEVREPKARLLGLKPGDKAELAGAVLSDDRALAGEKLKIEATIRSVQRAAIDVWAKALSDADQEYGFLVREDFTVGPPWKQWCQRFDWSADWQYKMLKQRIQWHRERFGEKCRWFYLDVFGNYTPPFVFEMLRADFPDCFFFAEHPNDAVLRVVQGWNWEGPMSELERFVAPDGLVTVLPDRMLTGDAEQRRAILARVWKNPHCFIVSHRGALSLVKMMTPQKGIAPQ